MDEKKKIPLYQEGFKELTPEMIVELDELAKANKKKLEETLDKNAETNK